MNNSASLSLLALENNHEFSRRHLGPDTAQQQQMLELLGVTSLTELIEQTVPSSIRLEGLSQAEGCTERAMLTRLKALASNNKTHKSYIGSGYYNTLVPNVILRNVCLLYTSPSPRD